VAANRLRTVEVDGLLGRVLLGKYRVDAILGHGGVGVVAACTHLALNERVAIKMLRENALDSEDSVERFMREAQAAAKLRSEYVARVTDVGKLETDVPYMVMELLDGQDLGKLIQLHGSLPAPSVVDLAIQTADALAEAHSHGIVHRDIKPSNLFVVAGDDGWTIKVLDFGISKSPAASEMRLMQTQSLLGTPAYMSPEQMRSARLVDARTDIWSLGIVMYEALEGRLPFPADSFSEMCLKVCSDPQPPMSRTPPKLAHVVEKCLAKEPDERYQSMAQLARDLVRFATDPARAAMIVERADRVTRRSMSMLAIPAPVPASRPRKKWPFVAAPLLAVAIGTTLGLWVGGRGDDAAAAADVPAAVAPAPSAAPPPPPPEPTKAAAASIDTGGSDRTPDPPEINIPDPPADPPAADPAKPARPRVPFKRPVIRKQQPPVKKTTPCKADNSMYGC